MYKGIIDSLIEILNHDAFLNITVSDYIRKHNLSSHEKSVFTKIIYGVCDKKIYLDYLIQPLTSGKRIKPFLRNAFRIATYVIEDMEMANHFIVNELVEVIKKFDLKASKFFNAIMRNYLDNNIKEQQINKLSKLSKLEQISIKYSYPYELLKLLYSQYQDKIIDLLKTPLESNNSYRINYLKTTKQEIITYLDKEQIEYNLIDDICIITKQTLINTPFFKEGKIVLQDYSSIKVGLIVDPKPNQSGIDCCGAPGGKSMHMAQIMNNQGSIITGDIHEFKMKLIKDNMNKLGVKIITPMVMDASKQEFNQQFDFILIDAPCSGLGVTLHKPDLKYRMTLEKIKEIKETQLAILNNMYKYLKPNGYLTYSTCTINKEENELMINEFIKHHPEFKIEINKPIWPNNYNDGFYICKLKKEA